MCQGWMEYIMARELRAYTESKAAAALRTYNAAIRMHSCIGKHKGVQMLDVGYQTVPPPLS